jgi:hypothetical protein
MILSYEKTVAAIVNAVVAERGFKQSEVTGPPHERLVLFIMEQNSRMPDYTRLPFKVLTILFDAIEIISSGRPFHRLPQEQRWERLAKWRVSRISFFRDFVRFYEGLVVFCWYSIEHEQS